MTLPIRESVLRMQPYSPGKPVAEVERELGLTDVVKLASNESPTGPSPKAVAAVREAARTMHLYPDAAAFELREAICRKFGVPSDQVLLGNGSDELLHLLAVLVVGEPRHKVIMGHPSFVRYDAAAGTMGGTLIQAPLDSQWRYDLDAMLDACDADARIVFIANPNNPTGTIVRRAELERFLDRVPPHVMVVLDEAYFEFAADEPDYPDGLELLKAGRNVVALRTFSKAYGLAGLRAGYGFAAPEIVDAYHRAREPFNVNSLAQAAAVAALGDEEHMRATVASNARGRKRLEAALRALGAEPVESFANFVVAKLGRPDLPVYEALLRRGVIVRACTPLGMPGHIRVTVGTEAGIERFLAAFGEVYAGVKA
jgi:histidinol-phosphate aminotransferase